MEDEMFRGLGFLLGFLAQGTVAPSDRPSLCRNGHKREAVPGRSADKGRE